MKKRIKTSHVHPITFHVSEPMLRELDARATDQDLKRSQLLRFLVQRGLAGLRQEKKQL
jgi:hypothetical protein